MEEKHEMTISSPTSNPPDVSLGAGASASTAPAGSQDVSKTAFLQLLVAQLKNQDPLNPTDGVQFLTQLAQFSQLEQLIGIKQDLDSVTGPSMQAT
jgi:flagellar basal-body rod modification protein FlgD